MGLFSLLSGGGAFGAAGSPSFFLLAEDAAGVLAGEAEARAGAAALGLARESFVIAGFAVEGPSGFGASGFFFKKFILPSFYFSKTLIDLNFVCQFFMIHFNPIHSIILKNDYLS